MFITTEDDNMFCVASDQVWRDSKHFWGGEHALCLHLTPEYKIIESKENVYVGAYIVQDILMFI